MSKTTVVAKKTFLGQNGAISSTTIFPTAEGGDFRISGYVSTADAAHGVAVSFQWNDGRAAQDSSNITGGFVSASGVGGFGQAVITIHAAPDSDISVAPADVGTQSSDYDLYITLEKVNLE